MGRDPGFLGIVSNIPIFHLFISNHILVCSSSRWESLIIDIVSSLSSYCFTKGFFIFIFWSPIVVSTHDQQLWKLGLISPFEAAISMVGTVQIHVAMSLQKFFSRKS